MTSVVIVSTAGFVTHITVLKAAWCGRDRIKKFDETAWVNITHRVVIDVTIKINLRRAACELLHYIRLNAAFP